MTTIHVVSGPEAPNKPLSDNTNPDPTPEITFTVGTRKSALAMKQTDLVLQTAIKHFPTHSFIIKARDTAAGDIDKVTPFKDMPVKNIWTHELETLMLEGSLDFLVHSLKDVPTQLPPNCSISATLAREDPRDAFVLKANRPSCRIQDLPAGSVIGTSSIRRTAQIAQKYPHLTVLDVRGNLGTRLSKLDADDSPFDALILASAGLLRLDLGHRITQYLDSKSAGMLYAVGQGAIGIENRTDDTRTRSLLSKLNHLPTFHAITAERALLRTIEGGCSAPLGIETEWHGSDLALRAIVVSIDGQQTAEVEMSQKVTSVDDAERLGRDAANEILRKGADKILAEIKAKRPTTVTDLEEK